MSVERWIQPQHLRPEAIAAYREQFEHHPRKVVRIRDFLGADVALSLHRLFAEEVTMELRHSLKLRGHVPGREWLEADPDERFYAAYFMTGVRPAFRLSPNVVTYLKLGAALRERGILDFFEQVTGHRLDGADFTPRAMARGQHVTPHIDDAEGRSLAFALYLSPGWRPEYGGAIQLFDPAGDTTCYEAEHNSIVVFDATLKTLHIVSAIEDAAGDARRYSLGGWFYGPSARSRPDAPAAPSPELP